MRIIRPFSILFSFFVFLTPLSSAEEPFKINLSYFDEGKLLQIDLERLSRDEVKDVMQKMVITVNDDQSIEENLLNQNHLNQITKHIIVLANNGDKIKVSVYYGYGDNAKSVSKELIVGKDSVPSQNASNPTSLLISDTPSKNQGPHVKSLRGSMNNIKKEKTFGYEMPGHQEYGQKGFGYTPDRKTYGYTAEEQKIYSQEPFGYERDDHKDIGEDKSYGYENFGYESKDPKYLPEDQ